MKRASFWGRRPAALQSVADVINHYQVVTLLRKACLLFQVVPDVASLSLTKIQNTRTEILFFSSMIFDPHFTYSYNAHFDL